MSLGETLRFPAKHSGSIQKQHYHRPTAGAALTPRESVCHGLMALAYSQKEIASKMGITYGTAKVLCCKVLAKAGVRSTGELIRRALIEPVASGEIRNSSFE